MVIPLFSDIDLVVHGNWEVPPLNSVRDVLVERKLARPDDIKVLDKAAVSQTIHLTSSLYTSMALSVFRSRS